MRTASKVFALLSAVALSAAACGSSPSGGTAGTSSTGHGTATVDYAGSLTGLVQTTLQPSFEHATGDHFIGKGEGSSDIANGILDGELDPGVFVSIGKKAIKDLFPTRAHFVVSLATDPLVIAYSPASRYATQLDRVRDGSEPLSDLFTLLETPGFRLARTNPVDDPQGGSFILMFELAEKVLHLPSGTASKVLGTTSSNDIGSESQIVDEDSLPTDLASGAFDAGSDYVTEARQYHLDYISLPGTLDFADPAETSLYSTVSLSLPTGPFQGDLITLDETYVLPGHGPARSGADAAADEAFDAFLLSESGQSLLKKAGYVLETPVAALASGFHQASKAMPAGVLAQFDRLKGTVSTS